MLRNLHLKIARIIFKFLQSVGLLIWKINFVSDNSPRIILSKYSLFIGVTSFIIIFTCMGAQLMTPIPLYETLYNTNISVFIRIILRFVTYSKMLVILIPIWVFPTKIKSIYEKLLKVKDILMEINTTISHEFIGRRTTYALSVGFGVIISLPFTFKFCGITNPWKSFDVVSFLATICPHLYGLVSLAHFTILYGMVSKRLRQVDEMLIKVDESRTVARE